MSKKENWFAVDEVKPTETCNVLVFANDIVSSWMEVVNAYVCPEYGNVIFEHLDSGEDYVPVVTHWRPLPPPP